MASTVATTTIRLDAALKQRLSRLAKKQNDRSFKAGS
jgi:predicted transcriptional regulator